MAGGTLYLVATPIGNLGDVTLRAIEILRAVPLIAAEDTRISRRLLVRHEIKTRTISYHAQSDAGRAAALLAHLRGGADLALVADAGTPAISDPGSELAAAWAAEGGRVEAIPGASAVLVAVAASGLAGPRWAFEGFLPRSGRERRERIGRIAADERGAVIFEAPGRMRATLADLAAGCGPDRPGAVCRELTKLHEQVVRGPLADLVTAVEDGSIPTRGEVVIIVGWDAAAVARGPGAGAGSTTEVDERAALREVDRLVAGGLGRALAARRVAAATGIPRRRLYRAT
ncbi:MAG: Ribosomal small subunit methyltransferase [Chloroflexi bacterium]|nr:Ribosomal small subunit methyltransferase [Chloroflexota bacterium]